MNVQCNGLLCCCYVSHYQEISNTRQFYVVYNSRPMHQNRPIVMRETRESWYFFSTGDSSVTREMTECLSTGPLLPFLNILATDPSRRYAVSYQRGWHRLLQPPDRWITG